MRVYQHHPSAEPREIVLNPEVLELAMRREYVFEQLAQARDVPRPVTDFMDRTTHGLLRTELEGVVEGRVRRLHHQPAGKDEQRLTDCANDRLAVERRLLLASGRHLDRSQHVSLLTEPAQDRSSYSE